MPTLNFSTVENASVYMHEMLEQRGFIIDATCSPSSDTTSEEAYRKYIALTQRVCNHSGDVLFYLTYRVTRAVGTRRPTFSSYQILSANYDIIDGAKWHLSEYDSDKSSFLEVLTYITSHYTA